MCVSSCKCLVYVAVCATSCWKPGASFVSAGSLFSGNGARRLPCVFLGLCRCMDVRRASCALGCFGPHWALRKVYIQWLCAAWVCGVGHLRCPRLFLRVHMFCRLRARHLRGLLSVLCFRLLALVAPEGGFGMCSVHVPRAGCVTFVAQLFLQT